MSPTLLASYALQAAGALITATLFGFFARSYEKPFLTQWARAWSAMCVMLAGAALNAAIGTSAPLERTFISVVTSIAAYLQIAWLLLGSLELVSAERAARMRSRQWVVLGIAAAVGIIAASLFRNDPEP